MKKRRPRGARHGEEESLLVDHGIDLAQRLATTPLAWDDLAVPAEVRREIEGITARVERARTISDDRDLGRSLGPGYRALFLGPPGTGKSLAVTLIGSSIGADVVRVAVPALVSRYIGETEKNLSKLLDLAESRDWILFFDEADALFGKRTDVDDAHDRYANEGVEYLLRQIEGFPGLAIVASNTSGDLDDAVARRFHSVVRFPVPDR